MAFLAALSPFFVRLLLKELEYGGQHYRGGLWGVSTMGKRAWNPGHRVRVHPPTWEPGKITVVFGGVLIACGVASLVLSASGAVRDV